MILKSHLHYLLTAVLLSITVGCAPEDAEVIVYTSLDRHLSEPVLQEFTRTTGIRVKPVYDVEASKTVGLVNRLIAESQNPRADVFWNSEVIHTLRLADVGLLSPIDNRLGIGRPADMVSDANKWVGFAARARVLIVNTDKVAAAQMPASLQDFSLPKWKNLAAFANPNFGTTGTHFSALYSRWGEQRFREWIRALKANHIAMLPGNAQVKNQVADGVYVFGLTDTDDANVAIQRKRPVALVFPDQSDGLGTLLIPNTVALVRGGPNPASAQRLIEYLLSEKVENALAAAPGAQIPLGSALGQPPNLPAIDHLKLMQVNYAGVASNFNDMIQAFEEEWHGARN